MLRTLDEAALAMKGAPSLPQGRLAVAYTAFGLAAWGIYDAVAERHFASVLTVSVVLQLLAFVLLALQVSTRGSCANISSKMLGLYAAGLCFKLSSTVWLNGYLPVDATGDWLFQATDVCSLLIVLWLLYTAHEERQAGRHAPSQDDMPALPLLVGCFAVAAVMHGDMNARPLWDTFWLTGLLADQLAVAPQLWLIARSEGRVEGMTSHHIAMMVLSRACSLVFWLEAWPDITCARYVESVNHVMWTIFLAHLAHFLLLADFGYYYVKAALKHGLGNGTRLQVWHDI